MVNHHKFVDVQWLKHLSIYVQFNRTRYRPEHGRDHSAVEQWRLQYIALSLMTDLWS